MERADLYLKVYHRKDGVGVTPRAQENIVSIIRWQILVYFVFIYIMVCDMLFFHVGKCTA